MLNAGERWALKQAGGGGKPKGSAKVKVVMHEWGKGKLHSGKGGKIVPKGKK